MTTYHYYPRSNKLVRQSPSHEYLAVNRRSSRPATPPPLTHSGTSSPASSPATPTLQRARTVHLGLRPEARARRFPREDELDVMHSFARHAAHCHRCSSPYETWRHGERLCARGRGYARDVTTYLSHKGGIPLSVIDEIRYNDKVEVAVPAECDVVRDLIKALAKGLSVEGSPPPPPPSSSARRPLVSHDPNDHVPSRRKTVHFDDERGAYGVEITPVSRRTARQERGRCGSADSTVAHASASRPTIVMAPRRGSLYGRDEVARHSRPQWDEDPVIIVGEPKRKRRTFYIR